MPVIFLYLFKLSLSLVIVYLFYRFVLQRLTFYNWNRFYLFAYTVLSFFIPFINITPVLERNEMVNNKALQFIPSITTLGSTNSEMPLQADSAVSFSLWDWALLLFGAGVLVMLARMLMQLFSFRKIVNKATLISNDSVKLYQVNQSIIPFSFGNSIFINKQQHNEQELEEIIRHEFVHIRQKHTIDIVWSELLCILNWYNPFVWLIRKSIRQNLEFIADHKVLQSGIDKKQYQYLLLKVTGNNHFSIASQFNFSSLKKRIAMMNKMKSANAQLIKFLFMLPLVAILLVAFRNNSTELAIAKERHYSVTVDTPVKILSDTLPGDSKPYILEVLINKKGNDTTIVVRDKNKKEIKRMPIAEWNEKESYYENLYGTLFASKGGKFDEEMMIDASLSEHPKQYNQNFFEKNKLPMIVLDGVEQPDNTVLGSLLQTSEIAKVTVLKDKDAIAVYGDKAKNGVIVLTSRAYAGKVVEEPVSTVEVIGKPTIATTSNDVFVEGKPISKVGTTATVKEMIGKPIDVFAEGRPTSAEDVSSVSTTVTAPVSAVKEVKAKNKTLAVIKSNTSEVELRKLESSLKSSGYNLKINKTEYKDGKLKSISGTINKINVEGGPAFVASDFSKLIITEAPDEDNSLFNFLVQSGNLKVFNAN